MRILIESTVTFRIILSYHSEFFLRIEWLTENEAYNFLDLFQLKITLRTKYNIRDVVQHKIKAIKREIYEINKGQYDNSNICGSKWTEKVAIRDNLRHRAQIMNRKEVIKTDMTNFLFLPWPTLF